jgi:hypothetical protein
VGFKRQFMLHAFMATLIAFTGGFIKLPVTSLSTAANKANAAPDHHTFFDMYGLLCHQSLALVSSGT